MSPRPDPLRRRLLLVAAALVPLAVTAAEVRAAPLPGASGTEDAGVPEPTTDSARAVAPSAADAGAAPVTAPAPIDGGDEKPSGAPGAPPAARGLVPPPPPVGAPAPLAAPPPPAAPFFSDPGGAVSTFAQEVSLQLKLYGDTSYIVHDNASWQWNNPQNSAPGTYYPGINSSFVAPRLDLFGAAEVGKLTFLTEVVFEALHNNVGVDIERMQLAYLFKSWFRLRAGRSHIAFGYYNDTYHHGNLFELTTARPYSVQFEDSNGILISHNVGLGIDGTIEAGSAGAFRYDLEIGNGRSMDVTAVPMEYAETKQPLVNARLRWMPVDGLILGVNGLRNLVPGLSGMMMAPDRPDVEELVGGAHIVYQEHGAHVDIEAFAVRHNPVGAPSSSIYGGFAELGYSIGAFTPYVRPEYIRFPEVPDLVFQYNATSAEATFTGGASLFDATRDFTDLRVGVKWLAVPQLALKLEGERIGHDGNHQEVATVKAAFGF